MNVQRKSLSPTISIVIPTYNRGRVLLDTIALLRTQTDQAEQILVIDQTEYASDDTVATRLKELHDQGAIHWVRLAKPSIPAAMNHGLQLANSEYVLFLDDDISIHDNFIHQHRVALRANAPIAQVGQIIQPWQSVVVREDYEAGSGIYRDLGFPFNSDQPAQLHNCMAGNLCVLRQAAIDVGGFDEQFSLVAYRFETEFCRRLVAQSGRSFDYVPGASLNHLKITIGGTRAHAQNHLTSMSFAHSVGDYYFAIQHARVVGNGVQSLGYLLKRPFHSLLARFYMRRPWWIPVRFIGELNGLVMAVIKAAQGPIYISEQ